MSKLQCPSCKLDIDGDSLYCDQCGEQIFICSSCGRAGKGKRCIFDGKEMIPATGTPQQPPQQPPAPQQQQQQPAQQTPPQPAASNKIKLSSSSLGINIEASDGDILGRSKGSFASVLGRFSHISGAHCKFIKTLDGWSITDMGSTNGTFYNGSRLTPHNPVPVQNNSSVKLADIELTVSFAGAEAGTTRI